MTWLLFKLLLWCVTLIDLRILKNSCIPGINATWSWCMTLLMYSWIWFSSYFIEVLVFLVFYWGFICVCVCMYFHHWYCPVILFSVMFLSCFAITALVVLQNEFGVILFSAVFWHSFKRTSFKFSLKVWYSSSVKTSGHGFFFVGSLDLLSLIFLAAQCGMQDLSLLARYKTHAACIGSMESEPLDCQVSLCWGFGNHSFIFSTCEWSVHISYFFLVQSCDIYF